MKHDSMAHNHKLAHGSALNPIKTTPRDYIPLMVITVFIIVCSLVYTQLVGNTLQNWMSATMGYFFVFFSLFKIIDLKGFAEGFSHYDIVASKVPSWAMLYPFIELALGALYLLGVDTAALHGVTFFIATLNVASVALKLSKKERFMCACLGTVLKVPLTTVALVEYGLMAIMALVMIVRT